MKTANWKLSNIVDFSRYFIETTIKTIILLRISGLAKILSFDNQSVNILRR